MPDARLLFADHDHLDPEGTRREPVFKPEHAPETLLGYDYLDGPTLLRSDDIRACRGWASDMSGAEHYDLILRVLERLDAGTVRHLPEVLCHRPERDVPDPQAADAAAMAVRAHLARRGMDLKVMPLAGSPGRRLRPRLPEQRPLVSLIIPTRDRSDLLDACVASILSKTTYEPYEIIVVDNGSVEPATHKLFAAWQDEPRIRVLSHPGPFNYAAINNAGVAEARGEVVGLINNDVEVISPDWLDELVGWAIQPEIGCVGAKLLFPDDTIQHGGIILGIGGVAAHAHKYAPRDSEGYVGRLARVHNVSAVTGACLVVRREVYQALGGLDEAYAVAYNDVDFCLRVLDAGYRNLFTPFAELYHHESKSRGADDTPEKKARLAAEVALMQARWGERLRRDPFYSPNLSQIHEDFGLHNPAPAWGWAHSACSPGAVPR